MTWQRKRTPTLGEVDITYHAIDSYVQRVPGAQVDSARNELARLAAAARFVYRNPTSEEIWRAESAAGALRLVVHRIARRTPILLTVIPWEQA
jgi:hypothetical protein